MSIFDNIIFDEFTLLEGKQADEYRKKKENEARAERYRSASKAYGRAVRTQAEDFEKSMNNGDKYTDAAMKRAAENNEYIERIKKSSPKYKKEHKNYEKAMTKATGPNKTQYRHSVDHETDTYNAIDAMKRHERREAKFKK